MSSLVKTAVIHGLAGTFESVITPITKREKSVILRGFNAFDTSVDTFINKAGAGVRSKDLK